MATLEEEEEEEEEEEAAAVLRSRSLRERGMGKTLRSTPEKPGPQTAAAVVVAVAVAVAVAVSVAVVVVAVVAAAVVVAAVRRPRTDGRSKRPDAHGPTQSWRRPQHPLSRLLPVPRVPPSRDRRHQEVRVQPSE
ncbi:MAG: hypothetical protein ACYDES_02750 [Acidimicrobiales bacterium]